MAGEWRRVRIDEIAEKIVIGPFGSRMKSDLYTETGIPVIRGANLTGGRSFSGDWAYVSNETADELANCNVVEGDLVFPHRGAIGEVGLVPGDRDRYLLSTSLMMLRSDVSQAYSLYLYYFFKSREGRHELLKNSSQVGTPGIGQPLTSLKNIDLSLPPLQDQRAIAHILGTLDDKIELNRRMNETLVAMARGIFKSWFVDFDPVRAKAKGEPPEYICRRLGLTPGLLAFFPDRFQNSELGEIPEGWEVRNISNVGNVVCGKTPSTKIPAYYGDDIPFVTIPDMHGNVFATTTQRKLSHSGATSQAKQTLPPGSICVSCIATPGLVVITTEDSQTNQQINSVVPREPNQTYYWFWTFRGISDQILAGGSGGSVLTNLSTGRFSEIRVLAATGDLRQGYQVNVAPLFEKILNNTHETRTLAALRHTLLPKLISGELRVPVTGAA